MQTAMIVPLSEGRSRPIAASRAFFLGPHLPRCFSTICSTTRASVAIAEPSSSRYWEIARFRQEINQTLSRQMSCQLLSCRVHLLLSVGAFVLSHEQ
jgi:hypothetical protein